MPFLTAQALDLDPDGMEFLRAVLGPNRGEGALTPLPAGKPQGSFEPHRADGLAQRKTRRARRLPPPIAATT